MTVRQIWRISYYKYKTVDVLLHIIAVHTSLKLA